MAIPMSNSVKPSAQYHCEAKGCMQAAVGIYGPECENMSGGLMYVCEPHFQALQVWMGLHPNEPVDCPTHGTIGKVKDYLILKRM